MSTFSRLLHLQLISANFSLIFYKKLSTYLVLSVLFDLIYLVITVVAVIFLEQLKANKNKSS